MYVDDCTYQINGKTYRRVLLRQSYRDSNGKTQHRNIANISSCSEEEIQGIKFVLKHKDNIDFIRQLTGAKTQNWKIVGPSLLLQQLSNSLGIAKALGHGKESNYILWQVFARLIQPCSRLGAVRLARNHCGCELLGIESIRENDLYESLVWLYGQKDSVEDKLFKQTANRLEASTIFLYDVSSSYFEGEHNELASYGYNRDKKKGKKQLVYGLLTDDAGEPLSIEAFKGNTSDPATLKTQIEKIKQKYGCKKVAIVGDKGMNKSAQIEDIHNSGLNYITTITKPQIESLIKSGVFQMELFSEELVEIINREEKVRYILRRNPLRAEEMRVNRQGKIAAVKAKVQKSNEYLQEHPRARAQVQERQLSDYIQKLKLDHILQVKVMDGERQIELSQNDEELENTGQLDGCYVIKTDLIEGKDEKEKIHSLYQSLASVEWAFRTEKSQLEIRPIYLRKEHRTRGHLMVCMLAYKIEKHLRQCWKGLDITVEEGMEKLSSIVGMKTQLGATKEIIWIPEPDELNKQLLDRANVILPTYLPTKETVVSTNEKLTKHRK